MNKYLLFVFTSLICISACKNSDEKPHDRLVNHIVLCWLKEPGNMEQRQQIFNISKSFNEIPGVIEVKVGEAIPSERNIVDDSFDVCIIFTFANVADMNAYLAHPTHQTALDNTIKPLVSKILIYDFLEN